MRSSCRTFEPRGIASTLGKELESSLLRWRDQLFYSLVADADYHYVKLTSSPEDRLPGICGTTCTVVGATSKDVSKGVTLLKNTAHESSGIWSVYER